MALDRPGVTTPVPLFLKMRGSTCWLAAWVIAVLTMVRTAARIAMPEVVVWRGATRSRKDKYQGASLPAKPTGGGLHVDPRRMNRHVTAEPHHSRGEALIAQAKVRRRHKQRRPCCCRARSRAVVARRLAVGEVGGYRRTAGKREVGSLDLPLASSR